MNKLLFIIILTMVFIDSKNEKKQLKDKTRLKQPVNILKVDRKISCYDSISSF